MIINKNDAILVILCFKMLDGGTAVQLWLLKDFGWRLGLCVFVFVIVFVFVFVIVIVFLFVRSCLLITLITCLKGHKSLRVLFGSVFQQWQ